MSPNAHPRRGFRAKRAARRNPITVPKTRKRRGVFQPKPLELIDIARAIAKGERVERELRRASASDRPPLPSHSDSANPIQLALRRRGSNTAITETEPAAVAPAQEPSIQPSTLGSTSAGIVHPALAAQTDMATVGAEPAAAAVAGPPGGRHAALAAMLASHAGRTTIEAEDWEVARMMARALTGV
ncbi:hypothetical protein FGG08_007548 [Glutinoglossum americanum]|uniref:Uncharacterized protein n=1 Tax=Glutinoglossum americanum TaxID=1670608 RepID=A0A9P8HYK3_9PEZI|nr:hypothetical protein FGG08_007548 [Glutinoglossum americanum]